MTESSRREGTNYLSAGLRLAVAGTLLSILTFTIFLLSGSWAFLGDGSPFNLVFLSAALLLLLGAYVSEPFFTRPVDALVNSLSLLIALIGVRDKEGFFGFWPAMIASLALLLLSVVVVAAPEGRFSGPIKALFGFITTIARSVVLFPVLYLLILVSYFLARPGEFWVLLTLLILLSARKPVESFVIRLSLLIRSGGRSSRGPVGRVAGRLSPRLVQVHRESIRGIQPGDLVELEVVGGSPFAAIALYDIHRAVGIDTVVRILGNGDSALHCGDSLESRPLATPLSGAVSSLESPEARALLGREIAHYLPTEIVGYVGPDSTVESLVVEIPESHLYKPELQIAAVVTAAIGDVEYLYQIVDAVTVEERIAQGDGRGFIAFRAQPLGSYNPAKRELSPPQWVPDIYSPVSLRVVESGTSAADSIGVLPRTNLSVPLHSVDDLVTHNTAILGILGVGKSSLTFELIQKVVVSTDVRVICIDITNEYEASLNEYVNVAIEADSLGAFGSVSGTYSNVVEGKATESGNYREYRNAVRDDLLKFLFTSPKAMADGTIDGATRVRIYNPDLHKISKGIGYNKDVVTVDLSQAEKTRIISEEVFRIVKDLGPSGGAARLLIVLEEAHSLVPEWNAVANEGDKAATNGTAKIILQGRKFGLGCFVITQRTANVGKSILNQCNTVFAMRIFDDTGKQFLENYVGKRYADALPTLAERTAIAVGRGLRLKQPVIVSLNDADDIKALKPKS